MNTLRLLRNVERPRLLCQVIGSANLGYRHPSTAFRDIPGYTWSYGQSPNRWCVRSSRGILILAVRSLDFTWVSTRPTDPVEANNLRYSGADITRLNPRGGANPWRSFIADARGILWGLATSFHLLGGRVQWAPATWAPNIT